MEPLENDRFLRALLREPVDRTPVWMMRQAGRYLPEYRATRERAGSFMALCKSPELACEVTLQPLERFPLDAAILFSDILTIPDAMGLGLYFAGRVPLIGFSGSPWTLSTYMVEGGSSKEYAHVKGMMFDRPELMHKLLDTIARSVTSYLNAQIAAGAQAVMIFDTWGGILTPRDYREFSLRYMEQIVAGLTREAEGRKVPVILFTKGGGGWLEAMADTGCDALGVDWTLDLGDARRILDSYGKGSGHVFNLGHGIHQHVDPEHAAAFVEAVHELSVPYHD